MHPCGESPIQHQDASDPENSSSRSGSIALPLSSPAPCAHQPWAVASASRSMRSSCGCLRAHPCGLGDLCLCHRPAMLGQQRQQPGLLGSKGRRSWPDHATLSPATANTFPVGSISNPVGRCSSPRQGRAAGVVEQRSSTAMPACRARHRSRRLNAGNRAGAPSSSHFKRAMGRQHEVPTPKRLLIGCASVAPTALCITSNAS